MTDMFTLTDCIDQYSRFIAGAQQHADQMRLILSVVATEGPETESVLRSLNIDALLGITALDLANSDDHQRHDDRMLLGKEQIIAYAKNAWRWIVEAVVKLYNFIVNWHNKDAINEFQAETMRRQRQTEHPEHDLALSNCIPLQDINDQIALVQKLLLVINTWDIKAQSSVAIAAGQLAEVIAEASKQPGVKDRFELKHDLQTGRWMLQCGLPVPTSGTAFELGWADAKVRETTYRENSRLVDELNKATMRLSNMRNQAHREIDRLNRKDVVKAPAEVDVDTPSENALWNTVEWCTHVLVLIADLAAHAKQLMVVVYDIDTFIKQQLSTQPKD